MLSFTGENPEVM